MDHRLAGIAFPFRISDGRVARAAESDKIQQDLLHLIGTRLGERPMLRSYGGGVHHRLQEANDTTLRALLRHEIEEGLRVFMPEVQLSSPLQLVARGEELSVTIEYVANPRDVIRRLELRLP